MYSDSFRVNALRSSRAVIPLLLLAAVPLLFIELKLFESAYPRPRSLSTVQNLAHVPLFLMASVLITQLLPLKTIRRVVSISIRIAILVTAGAIIEALQSITGREASWLDLRLDLLGIALFFTLFQPVYRANDLLRRIITAAALCWLVLEAMPLARSLIDEQMLRTHPQLISDFETWGQHTRWSRGEPITTPAKGRVLRVPLPPGRYAGTKAAYIPRDWSDFKTLQMEIFNPEPQPLTLVLKIEDAKSIAAGYRYDMRFNGDLYLQPGWNRVSMPLQTIRTAPRAGRLDLNEIAALSLFEIDRQSPGYLLLDNLVLR